ncbi:hypothetical protein BN1110_04735 [bacterium YEK0313]|nr:hypothetical protein BN1110_04735 [bacterium YEK0313]
MIARWMVLLALATGLFGPPAAAARAPCPASLAPAERLACLAPAETEAEAALVVARNDAVKAIADWHGQLDADERKAWSAEFARALDLWVTFRNRTCAADLLAFQQRLGHAAAEAASRACRIGLTRVIVGDLTNRFGEQVADRMRGHLAGPQRGPNRRDLIGAEGGQPLCRHPGRGGDYAPLTTCYERHAARLDARLETTWSQVLAAIRAREDVPAAGRARWSELLTAAQQSWKDLRDLTCRLEAYETPNRWAHSIYAMVTGPCRIVETEERIRTLASAYGLRRGER